MAVWNKGTIPKSMADICHVFCLASFRAGAGIFIPPHVLRIGQMATKRNRPDHDGAHRLAFDRAKKKILASDSICGICGLPVDKSLKYPHPMSPCIDHIIPIDRGGHPSDMSNLQLAHWKCNRAKSNKLIVPKKTDPSDPGVQVDSNRNFPMSMDWSAYRAKG